MSDIVLYLSYINIEDSWNLFMEKEKKALIVYTELT